MGNLYKTIEYLCSENGVNITTMCSESGASRGSLTDLKMGRKQSLSAETLSKIADYFGVTVDYLLTGDQKEKPALEDKDGLTARDHRDIARDLERIMSDIESSETLMFDGDPATEGARETLRNALAMGLEYAKKVNKETYTPKKYRKSKE